MDKYKVMNQLSAIADATRIIGNENNEIEDTDRVFIAREVHKISVANIAVMERLTEMMDKGPQLLNDLRKSEIF